ncbi:MAG: GNAT family N-acetyltransferase [Acidimicrobiia bacterium]
MTVEVAQSGFMGEHVIRLSPDDFRRLRTIRLAALASDPDAFGSSYEREAGFHDEVWLQRLQPDANPHCGYEDDTGTLVGMMGLARNVDDPALASVFSMWVAPERRGTGVADELFTGAVAWANDSGVTAIRLDVMGDNSRAEAFYARHGFTRTGTIAPIPGSERSEVEMRVAIGAPRNET